MTTKTLIDWREPGPVEYLREKWKITEMRDGCVYKTKSMGYVWVTSQEEMDQEGKDGVTFSSPSTSVPEPWARKRKS
jgi:hypothetical protein